jgi:hypothetical protein
MLNVTRHGIHSLFEDDKSSQKFFYDILLFGSTANENESFKTWDTAEFILINNREVINHYQGSKKNKKERIEAVNKRIKRNIAVLVELRLMKQTGMQKEDKGTGMVPVYKLTMVGHIISRIIPALENGTKEQQLYSLFQEKIFRVQNNSPSIIVFASKFIKKIYEKGLFTNYVSIFRQVTKSKPIEDISTFALLIQSTLNHELHNLVEGPQFIEVWEETINELPPEERKLYLYEQKLSFEIKMGSKAMSKEYEKLRLEVIGEAEIVALEGFCNECDHSIIFPMKIVEYIRRLAFMDRIRLARICPKCQSTQPTLQLPNLWV